MGTGLLSTAGNLLFAGDNSAHILAMDSTTGKTLWHTTVAANQANGAITYELDGKQYVVVGAGDARRLGIFLDVFGSFVAAGEIRERRRNQNQATGARMESS